MFSLVGDRLNERLRKVFESKALAKEPKVYESVRSGYSRYTLPNNNLVKHTVFIGEISRFMFKYFFALFLETVICDIL